MYLTKKIYVKPDMKMSDVISDNPSLLIVMENFDIDTGLQDKTVKEICDEAGINHYLLIFFANLYNGFIDIDIKKLSVDDISTIIKFLKNSHRYYKSEKFKEISYYIEKLNENNKDVEIKLVEKFYKEYYEEVIEHLDYEDQYAFPYFLTLIAGKDTAEAHSDFSADEYKDHHTDIDSKLEDLKNLLLKHISIKQDRIIKRKLLKSLFELDYDIKIHSIIEETILVPLVNKIENA